MVDIESIERGRALNWCQGGSATLKLIATPFSKIRLKPIQHRFTG
jgi:hypothetical protein